MPGGSPFSRHPLHGAHELRSNTPLPGWGFRRLRTAGTCRAPRRGTTPYPRRGAKRKGHLRFPFLFELLPFPCFLIWRRPETGDRFENGNGSRVTVAWLSPPFRSSQIAYCYTGELLYAGATCPCRATLWCVVTHGTYEFRYLGRFIFAGPVCNNALTNRAARLCRTQRRVNLMCSSTLSMNCEKAEKDTLW